MFMSILFEAEAKLGLDAPLKQRGSTINKFLAKCDPKPLLHATHELLTEGMTT